MKSSAPLSLLFAGLLLAGCASHKSEFSSVPGPSGKTSRSSTSSTSSKRSPAPVMPQPIVTPDTSLAGKVVRYNAVGRFAVLSFPVGQLPKTGETLFLYRNGLKVAEIKVTGPETDHFTVADVVTGEAQTGDEVRDQ
jgi:hypothetical protein